MVTSFVNQLVTSCVNQSATNINHDCFVLSIGWSLVVSDIFFRFLVGRLAPHGAPVQYLWAARWDLGLGAALSMTRWIAWWIHHRTSWLIYEKMMISTGFPVENGGLSLFYLLKLVLDFQVRISEGTGYNCCVVTIYQPLYGRSRIISSHSGSSFTIVAHHKD